MRACETWDQREEGHGRPVHRRPKDGRIKTRDLEIQPVLDRCAVLFCLDNQQLRSLEMVERLDVHRSAIYRAVEKGGPAAYAVRQGGLDRTWP
ncbi:hypothetical protein OG762_18685 [Streptomyces sp. NBC_01136]|uniref:hypothetical protein n=1 Tax=unclassified Streptomyces TaxID=2593676 RepID=UPI003249CE0E|nr:hypothetical protein OG762_18685 [Streptomyces sp. NBC_01136]